jgi:tetratricopeptide (TPR) repeat protein
MDNVRQALRLPASDKQERAALLEEASRARPDDYCLRELYEQSGAPEDRAAWLMGRVGEGATAAAAPLALEAALAAELEGDYELAARCAQRAIELGDQRLAPVFARRLAFRGHGVEAILEGLQAELRQAREPSLRAELLEYMAQIEARGRGDREAATALLRTLVSEQPGHLAALHAIEAMAIAQGDVSGIADVCMLITQALEGGEMIAHAQLAARLLQQQGRWEDSYDAVKVAASVAQPSHWALRQMLAHSRARGDHAVAAGIACALAEGARATLDRATLLLRGAEGSQAGGDDGAASDLLGEVLELWPRHQVALAERAALLERLGKAADAARCLEDLAMACQAPQHRIERLYQAAVLWLSQENAEGQDEGRRLLEAVGTIDATYKDTFERLQAIYLAAGAKRELAELLAARLDGVTDPEERIELEVLRGKMLVEAGSAGEAREALSAALEANPDNPEALSAFADVCAAEGEWEQVEQAIIRLGRLVSDPAKQCEIYLRLGALYDEHLPNLERAEMAYQEVLKRAPDNTRARAKLVDLFLKSGDTQRAFAEQEELINAAKSQEEKCDRTVKLAEIFEASGDPKQAEQTLIKARRTWAKEAGPVAALYRFYKRTGQGPAADMLLDRAAADVRRGLGAGRFEAQLFAMAQTVADLRGQADAAVIARATLSAITGEPAAIEGVGLLAGQPELDEHTAPEVLTTAFRQLLKATGDVMDEAVPFDLKAVRAKPLPPPHADVLERTREIAAAYGLPDVQVLATNALGNTCIPARSEPPTLCMGLPLVTAEEAAVREFLIHRAVKVLQTRTAALSRTAPIDLWPLMAAYLQLHSSSFQPHGVDPTKVAMFKEKMGPAMPPPDPQLSLLASDVIGTIGNRASSLNTVTNSWGSRAALLALGDPNLALEAIAWAGGATSPPADPGERVRWIGRQAEARDLIVFSVSDGYATARATLGADASMLDAVEFIDADPE